MGLYIDDLFPAYASWSWQWQFINFHLLPRLDWSMMKLSLGKVSIGFDEILALGEMHRASGIGTIKSERVRVLTEWPTL